jgi:hypothetical protein
MMDTVECQNKNQYETQIDLLKDSYVLGIAHEVRETNIR